MMKKLLFWVLLFLTSNSYSQTHTYKFNNVLTEFGGIGPALTQVFDVTCGLGGTPGAFASQLITTSSCTRGPQPVFTFTDNAGLSYPNIGPFISGTYTINMLYKVNSYLAGSFSFQRIIDFKNATTDDGLYTHNNGGSPTLCYAISGTPTNIPTVPALIAGRYYLITLVRDAGAIPNPTFTVYLNGTAVLTNYNDAAGLFATASPDIFFRDDASTGCETSAGAVRYITISNTTSSALSVQTTWITLCNGLLEANLVSFNGQKNNNDALLQWQTGNEINTSHFDIERSYNGQSYTSINTINAKQAAVNNYTYNDPGVFSSSNVNVFYRLKMVDISGNYKYSPVVKLSNSKAIKISVFPNPASDAISISGLHNTDVIKLISIEGKVLMQQNAGAESVIMHIEKYQSGTYIIQVQNDREVTQQKFVKY